MKVVFSNQLYYFLPLFLKEGSTYKGYYLLKTYDNAVSLTYP